jgi:hypothetical protein
MPGGAATPPYQLHRLSLGNGIRTLFWQWYSFGIELRLNLERAAEEAKAAKVKKTKVQRVKTDDEMV